MGERRVLYDLFEASLAGRGRHPCLVSGGVAVTYGALGERIDAFAAWLIERGVRPGDRVVLQMRKSVEEVVVTLGCARVGAVFCNVSPQWTPTQLEYVVGHCEPVVLVCDARRQAELEELDLTTVRHVAVVGGAPSHPWAEAFPSEPKPVTAPLPGPDDLAALLYTSGSTGRPKGVMVTHRNLVDGAEIVAGYLGNRPDDRVLGFLPMSFDYGLNQLTSMLHVGGTLVLQPIVLATEIVRTIQTERVTGLALVPPAWVQLVRLLEESGERLPSLRYATNSGGKIPAPVLDALPDVLPGVDVVLMYGLTEGFRSTYLPPDRFDDKRGSMGRAVPGVEIHVVHPDRGRCGPGEVGELVHSGKLISRGYWRDPEATASRIRPSEHLRDVLDDEPVLFSGDLVHADEEGYLWFHSRGDEMIKCSGHRLSPTEVEDALHGSGLVQDAVVFGVADDELGQVVHAAVTPRNGALEAGDLLRHCRSTLPGYMVPREIHVFDEAMPRTGSGKLDRPAVVRTCRENTDA